MAHQIISYARTFPSPGHPDDLFRWVQGVSSFFFSFFFAQNTKKVDHRRIYLALFCVLFFSVLSTTKKQYRACPMSLAHHDPTTNTKEQETTTRSLQLLPMVTQSTQHEPEAHQGPLPFHTQSFSRLPSFFRFLFHSRYVFCIFPHVDSTKVDRQGRQLVRVGKKKYVPTNTCAKKEYFQCVGRNRVFGFWFV